MSKKRVIVTFISLLVFGVLMASIQIFYYGGFPGITGFSVLERSEQTSLSDGDFDGVEFVDGKLALQSGEVEGEFVSDVLDFRRSVIVTGLAWEGNSEGKTLYMKDESGVVVSSVDEGESWRIVDDETIVERVLNARTKSALVERGNGDIEFYARACEERNCEGESFSRVNLDNVNLEGRYFQYKIVLKSENGAGIFIESVELEYEILERENINNDVVEKDVGIEDGSNTDGGAIDVEEVDEEVRIDEALT